MSHPDLATEFFIDQSAMIAHCYQQTTGRSLYQRLGISEQLAGAALAEALYHAPAVILSHDLVINGTQRDNLYNYANLQAQQAFERSFTELTSLASSNSTGMATEEQRQRNTLLAQSLAHGYVEFTSTRLSASGQNIALNNAVLFVLFDDLGLYRGQAVVFDR